MIFLIDLILVFLVALVFTTIFAVGFKKQRSRANLSGFFLLLLLGTWAVYAWVPPAGWLVYGVAWAQLLLIGLMIALLMAAFISPVTTFDSQAGQKEVDKSDEASLIAFDLFFWFLLIGLMMIILTSYRS
ncbi:MAG TPA: hypothetical protein VKN62_08685 [Pelovirga sp.]|nr:hypothetical protein [Pelovirga sp.]